MVKRIVQLLPDWIKDPQPGLDPTMYGTGTYEGDLEEHKKIFNFLREQDSKLNLKNIK